MQRAVVEVGRNAWLDKVPHAVHFLLVRNQVLDGSNDAGALDAFNG